MAKSSKKNHLRRGFKSDSEKLSTSIREELGLSFSDKLCGFELAKSKNVFIYTLLDFGYEEKDMYKYEDWSAVTFSNKNGDKIIIHNHTHSSGR